MCLTNLVFRVMVHRALHRSLSALRYEAPDLHHVRRSTSLQHFGAPEDTTYQMRILHLFHHRDVIQLDVQVLIHALQGASDGDVVLELDSDLVVDQRLEEAEKQHDGVSNWGSCYRGGG